MRTPVLLAALLVLAGCGGLNPFGGAPDLSNVEVAGRYEFTTFTLDPVSEAVRDYRVLGNEVSEDLTLRLDEDGSAALERLRGGRVDEVYSDGSYTISGRSVRVAFGDRRAVERFFLPSEVTFEGGGERLRAELFREGLNLERISNDYRGVTSADVRVRIELREIG